MLCFDNEKYLQFRCALGSCLIKHNKLLKEVEAENDVLLEAAETKDKRQQKLDHFFREAYSRAFNVPKLSDGCSEFNSFTSEQVLHMTLTKEEFADALGMNVKDLFVKRMFSCMLQGDANADAVCFQEFLNVLKRFTQGSLDAHSTLFLKNSFLLQDHSRRSFSSFLTCATRTRTDTCNVLSFARLSNR